MSRKLILTSVAVVVVAAAVIAWLVWSRRGLPPGFAGGNGRLEATEVDIAAKYAGRISTVLVDEGAMVDAGQVVAIMDTEPLNAQLSSAEAQIREAQDNLRTAVAQVAAQKAELTFADKQFRRANQLVGRGAISEQELDIDRSRADVARASLAGASAQAVRAQSAIDSATGEAERLRAEIRDNTLKSPIRARVQSRMAEPGEVLAAGGKVLALIDLSDVYMYVFLPAQVAGKVALGSEARIVLDAMPQYPIRAITSFVSPNAQFTPKTVETAEERHNLSFRVKLQLDRERLRSYERLVKVGIPGMGYVRFDKDAQWPQALQTRPVSELPWQPTGTVGSK